MKKLIPIIITALIFTSCASTPTQIEETEVTETTVTTESTEWTTKETTIVTTTEVTPSSTSVETKVVETPSVEETTEIEELEPKTLEEQILFKFKKAQELYQSSDGFDGFVFIKVNDKYYENGNENKRTYEQVISEYHKYFTDDFCQQIFSGKHKKGTGEEYDLNVITVITSEGHIHPKFSEDSKSYSNYDLFYLFGSVRGTNFNNFGEYIEIKEITENKITLSCTAIYAINNPDDQVWREVEYKDNNWVITKSDDENEIGTIFKLTSFEYTEEYIYNMILENGEWKFDNFELWY